MGAQPPDNHRQHHRPRPNGAGERQVKAARAEFDLLTKSVELATESLRLVNMRYQGGESTVLEVVDAQNTLIQARNAYDDAETRYRVAISTLQTVTGPF